MVRDARGRKRTCLVCLATAWLGCSTSIARAEGSTWIEQAEAALTCTALADAGETAQLAAPSMTSPGDPRYVRSYISGQPADERQGRYRHLLMLSAIAWWADLVNDQAVRVDALLTIGVLADTYVKAGADMLYEQVARCARAQLISAEIELGHTENVTTLAANLLQILPAKLPQLPAEDGPLLIALRDLKLAPEARNSLASLATRAVTYASDAVTAKQPQRASRLLASAGDALQAMGDATRAQQLALQSLLLTGKPPAVDAAWRAMPTLYDAAIALHGPADAANLQLLLRPDQPPSASQVRYLMTFSSQVYSRV